MKNKDFFEETLKDEMPRFERALKALPDKLKDWKAHPKNRNTEEVLWVLVYDSRSLPALLKVGEFDFGGEDTTPENPKSTHEMAKELKENMERAAELSSKMSEGDWDKPAKLMMNGKVMWETTKGAAVWATIFDMVHHRGQLSTHIRPQGGKVPSIYGPSADDSGGM